MLKLVRSIVSVLARRFRRRAVLELEVFALRHHLFVLRRQRDRAAHRARAAAGANIRER
jgi:hypothetical protein